jgi:Sortilin, neurotensin receptor 3,
VGLVIGTGNLGRKLTGNGEPKNLYISRDGGLTWRSVKPGTYIYEIGDHGSIIVIARKD